jgi:hypothetical protein
MAYAYCDTDRFICNFKKTWGYLTCFFVYMYKKSEIDKLQAVFCGDSFPISKGVD